MFGESWSGFNALQVAMRAPPALKAIVAAVATENIYQKDGRFADGILVFSDWTIIADVGLLDIPPPADPFDEEVLRNRFDRPPWSLTYLRHQRDGDFWRHRQRLDANPDLLNVPTMMIGGWYDGYRSAVLRALKHIRAPFKAIVGPWDHGMTIPAPEADLIATTVRWWDFWLKGLDNGVLEEPALHVYMRKPHLPGPRAAAVPGEWRSVADWPPEGYRELRLYFAADRSLRKEAGEAATHRLRYVPTGGVQAGIWWADPMPDQRPADAYSLIYESEPLDHQLQLLGQPRAALRATSSAPLANWMVRLSDVAPDGTVTLITGAARNGAHRDSSTDPELLSPGRSISLDIPLHFTSWVFEPGHRIRVAVSNALWPMFWPSPYSMTTTFEMGTGQESHITLPIVPAASRKAAQQAASAVGSRNLSFREAGAFPAAKGNGWIGPAHFERDEVAGVTTVTYTVGTVSRIVVKYQAYDTDPAKARYLGTLRVKWPWNDEEAELYGETEIVSDETSFHYRHARQLLRNGIVVREKTWKSAIPRDHQ
jgi:predicted acyl esterase